MSKKWPIVSLSEVITERRQNPSPEDLTSGHIRIVSKISFASGKLELRTNSETKTGMILAYPGDLVVSGINAAKGAIAIYETENTKPIAATIHYGAYTPNPARVNLKYLWWFLRSKSFQTILEEHIPGGIKTELKSKRLLPIPIPLPPLEEQQRIVARIQELAGAIAEARALRARSIEETNLINISSYNDIFSKYKYNLISIENLIGRANLKNGKSLRPDGQKSSIRCLRVSAIRNGLIDCHDSKLVPMTEEEAKPYLIKAEDIFIVRGNGSKDLIGQAGIVKKILPNTIFPDLFIKITINPNQLLPDFFVAWWRSPQMREKITEAAKTTSGIWKINQGHIASFSVPVPSLSEQKQVIDYLHKLQAKVDALKRLQAETTAELDALLPSILDKAFKGEL